MATSQRRLACVKCDLLQPENGKLLKCLHVTCPDCAADSISGEWNCITCSFCGIATKPLVAGVPIILQLASCVPSLYKSADATAQLTYAADGGQERRLCDWCDEGSEGEATHSCEQCSGTVLCAKHVEHHSRKKAFAGHIVQLLSGDQQRSGGPSTLGAESNRCFFHVSSDIITFCTTCSHGVCAQCISSDGHSSHTIESLQSVADKETAAVRSLMEPKPGSADSKPASPLKAISSLIEVASKEMEGMREEARVASAVVTDTFDRIESVLQEKRQELLRQIEETHWRQLAASESRQQRLYRLEETHATLEQLTESLTSVEMKQTDVIRVAGVVKEHLATVKSDFLSSPHRRDRIAAMLSTAGVCPVEAEIRALVYVSEGEVDVTKCAVTIPDDTYTDEGFDALITLPIPPGNPTPEVTATYIAPSAQIFNAPVVRATTSSETTLVLLARITPAENGNHTLEIRDRVNRVKSVPFTSTKSPAVVLDPRKCSNRITLGNRKRTATHTSGNSTLSSVAAREGYTTGRHSWNVRLSNAKANGSPVGFGVSIIPSSLDFNKEKAFFGEYRYYCWRSFGDCHAVPKGKVAECSPIENGDVVTLTLDCMWKTLELHLHRTNERRTIIGLDCSERLYPAFCLWNPGHQATFC